MTFETKRKKYSNKLYVKDEWHVYNQSGIIPRTDITQVTILLKIRGNSQESFLGIRGNSQESFTGKSGENVDRYSGEFPVTHSEEFDSGISRELVLGFSPELVTRSSLELDPFVFWGIHSQEILEKFLNQILRNGLREIPWNTCRHFHWISSGKCYRKFR